MAKQVIPLNELPVVSKTTLSKFKAETFTSGAALLMDKPLEWSSFDVVRFVRNRIPPKKTGHAGTLDPLATGLLILCTGGATRTISQIQAGKKEYITTIRFGESTPSYDAALPPDGVAEYKHITPDRIKEVIEQQFTGTITQLPPIYSAIRVRGERLYKKARRGEKIELPPRQITVHSIDVLEENLPDLKLKITCGKGTYIRSIAHDLGKSLDSLAHITSLRRTRIGGFDVEDACTPDEFDNLINQQSDE
ncbi:MAG: tRNA pseudouridine(55) synthase TruB [Balneolaceae bacterium]